MNFFKNKRIYFHIDEVARDSIVASALEKHFKGSPISLTFGNRHSSNLLKYFDRAFDLYILPSIDHFYGLFPDIENCKARVVILPTESIGGTTDNLPRLKAKYFGSKPELHKKWHEATSFFCLWGSSHLAAFIQSNVEESLIEKKTCVVGHPRFDKMCRGLQKSVKATQQKKRIGFITRFTILNPYDERSLLEGVFAARKDPKSIHPLYTLSPNHDIEDRIYTEVIDLRFLYDVMENIDFERYDVSIRVHPRENRLKWKEQIDRHGWNAELASWDLPYSRWLSSVDTVIGPTSTSFYDCIISGRKPICTNNLHKERSKHTLLHGDDYNSILGYVYMPSSLNELFQNIEEESMRDNDLFEDEHLKELFYQEVDFPYCESSISRLASCCQTQLKIGT